MIRFQDTVEKKDDSELLSSTGFQDIKPTGSMSTEEAVSFLDGLFSVDPDSQDMYSVEDESLLAKIFGRYEDEFDFDFELDDEVQLVLDRFDSDKWERLSDGERKVAIQDLAAVIGKKLGLEDNSDIKFYDGRDGSCGAYLPLSNTIFFSNGVRDEQDGQQTIFVDFTATKNCPSYRLSLFLTAFIFSSRSTAFSFLRRIVFHAGNSPARNSPQIQTGNAAIRTEPPAVFFKQLAVYFPVVVDHTQPTLDCQIIKTENIRTLQAE